MWLRLRPESPVLIGRMKADSAYLSTLSYIPGRILRGAWVESRRIAGQADTIAGDASRVQIWNFYPSSEGALYSLPLPLSAWTCKRRPGFQPEGHGILDSLIPRLAYELLEREGAQLSAPFQIVCDRCQDRMTPTGGYFARWTDGSWKKIHVPVQFQTKVAMSRRRRAAMEGMLYQVTAIAPDESLTFVGRMHGPKDLLREILEAIHQIGIGAMTRRGYGAVSAEEISPPGFPFLQDRIHRFNDCLQKLWRDLRQLALAPNGLPDHPPGCFLTVDLLSPGIFLPAPFGPPLLFPTLNIRGRSLYPIFWITRPTLVGGWSTAWGLPKPVALAASPGSSYVFLWQEEWGPLDIRELERIEEEGVGERTDEGFGEVMICHPFHLEVEPV